MVSQDIDQLFVDNIKQLNKLNIASASMFKAFIQALEASGNVYIRLAGAEQGGHSVKFSYVAGDQSMIETLSSALGLLLVGNTLEANHA
jgi:hypothetical protein